MLSFRASLRLRKIKISYVLGFAALFLLRTGILLHGTANAQQSAPPPQPTTPVAKYDKALFQKPIPPDQLAFLNQFNGVPAKDVIQDKQFRKLLKNIVPDCIFHYGTDMMLPDALDMVIKGSPLQAQIRDARYFMISGLMGPHHGGRGFIWIDMQDGIGLGGFYFHPGNGEPTPTVAIFSRQVLKQDSLALSQLPPAFIDDLVQWSTASRVAPVTTRYFITGSNKRILLEHNEDYCMQSDGTPAPPDSGCEQMDADAADMDMVAASYLEQTHHATNATAWMITDPDQVAWLQVRANTCGPGPNQLACRIRMTRARTHGIIMRNSGSHSGRR